VPASAAVGEKEGRPPAEACEALALLHVGLSYGVGKCRVEPETESKLREEACDGELGEYDRLLLQGVSMTVRIAESDSMCFLDKDRICGEDCKALNKKTKGCRILERQGLLARFMKQLMAYLSQGEIPRIG
jgi:hypothetical protein